MAMYGSGVEILVQPDVLRQTADEVTSCIGQVETLFVSVQTTVGHTRHYWIGEAGDLHRKAFEEQMDDIDQILVRLREHPVDLLKIAGIYDETDTRQAEASSQMSSNLIE